MSSSKAAARHDLPNIVTITPSSMEAFTTCPRRYALQHLHGVPASDGGPSNTHGLVVHDLLYAIHSNGSCHDDDHIDRVLREKNQDTEVNRLLIRRHAQRCPTDAEHSFHERTYVRFLRSQPMFLATARYDAIWVRGNVVDVREFKTGARWYHDLAEDPRAIVQAWVLAKRVAASGRVLRLRYEYLSPEIDDDPDPWEPGEDDIVEIGERLHDIVKSLHDSDWSGINDETWCRSCRYRSVCRDSASVGEPIWASLGIDQ